MFTALDDYMWKLTYKWAVYSHPNKSKRWVVNRYFGMFNKSRRDRWVFGDRDSGVYLLKFAWTRIVRHQLVTGAASPDDPALADYWAERRRKACHPRRSARPACGSKGPARSLSALRGLAPARRRPATNPTRVGAMAGDHPQDDHQDRHAQGRHVGRDRTPSHTHPLPPPAHAGTAMSPALLPAHEPQGLLEPDAVKAARPVLRGAGRSNAPGLPGGGGARERLARWSGSRSWL